MKKLTLKEMKQIKAREIHSALVQQSVHSRPAGTGVAPIPAAALGFGAAHNRAELDRRHHRGVESLRNSPEVKLAVGRLAHHSPKTKLIAIQGANNAGWNTQVAAAFYVSRSAFAGDRFGAILRLVDETYGLVLKQYGRRGIPRDVVLNLAGASVKAYAYGFCVAFEREQ